MASSLILLVVFVFDLIAFALAVAAEQRRNKATIVQEGDYNYCRYDSDIATGLGVGSVVFIAVSQTIIMHVTRCLCCGKALSPSRSRSLAIFLFITNWVTYVIAVSCLTGASVTNAYHTKSRTYISHNPPSCETLRKGLFGAGAAFVVLTGIASELFYVSYTKASDVPHPYARDTGVRMGNL